MTSRSGSQALLLIGVALVILYVGSLISALGVQAALSRRLDAIAPDQDDAATLSVANFTRQEARTSGLIGRLEIPRIGLSAMVVEGTDSDALRHGIGHVLRTGFPGERENVALAAHRDTYFRPLRRIEPGDRVRMRTPDGVFEYRVDSILVVTPDRVDLVGITGRPMLTMVTCYPFHWVGPAPLRYVVRATGLATQPAESEDPALGPTAGGEPDAALGTPALH